MTNMLSSGASITTTTTHLEETFSSEIYRKSSNKSEPIIKSSCSDLQSRLKVRKLLGVGDTVGSKISQILGHSDTITFELPANLDIWLFLTTILFSCFAMIGLFWPSFLRFILLGGFESTLNLSISYVFFASMIGLTLRSRDRISLERVLVSLTLFHILSFFTSLWFLKTSDTKTKSMMSSIFHLSCLLINIHFYRLISTSRSHRRLKSYFNSLLSFQTLNENNGHDSS